MSRHHSFTSEVAHLRAELANKTHEELKEIYGITLNKDGTVLDNADYQIYKNLIEWIKAYVTSMYNEENEYDNDEYGNFDDDE